MSRAPYESLPPHTEAESELQTLQPRTGESYGDYHAPKAPKLFRRDEAYSLVNTFRKSEIFQYVENDVLEILVRDVETQTLKKGTQLLVLLTEYLGLESNV